MAKRSEPNDASARLHHRVREFARLSGRDVAALQRQDLEQLVVDLHRYHRDLRNQDEALLALGADSEMSRQDERTGFASAPVALLALDRSAEILRVNTAGARLLGAESRDLLGRRLSHFVAETEVLRFWRHWNDVLSDGAQGPAEFGFENDCGEALYLRLLVSPPPLEGAPCSVALIDVTPQHVQEQRRQETERRLLQSHRMDAVGKLADGIAHNFNNLLLVILGNAETILRRADGEELDGIRGAGEEIASASHSASVLVRELMTLGRLRRPCEEEVDVNRVLDRMEPLLVGMLPVAIRLVSVRADGPMWVRIDHTQFEQAILNLVINACDAMPDGGRLTLTCRPAGLKDPTVEENTDADRPRAAEILFEVRDDGVGMEQDALDHLFEPFFTTKTADGGSGLGLSMIYALVHGAGGRISVKSRPGEGTAITLLLPAVEPEPEPEPDRSTAARDAPKQGGTILVCEDDESVRRLLCGTLEDYGYTVIAAETGARALELAMATEPHVDLVVTDIDVPGLNGIELAQRLLVERPDLNVLFISGHTGDLIEESRFGRKGWDVLRKPFSLVTLVARIRETIDRRGH